MATLIHLLPSESESESESESISRRPGVKKARVKTAYFVHKETKTKLKLFSDSLSHTLTHLPRTSTCPLLPSTFPKPHTAPIIYKHQLPFPTLQPKFSNPLTFFFFFISNSLFEDELIQILLRSSHYWVHLHGPLRPQLWSGSPSSFSDQRWCGYRSRNCLHPFGAGFGDDIPVALIGSLSFRVRQ